MSRPTSDRCQPIVGQCVTHALLWEAAAAKPGNVHRGADFEDLTFADFATAAVAVGRAIDNETSRRRVGPIVLAGVGAMNRAVATNTHLGAVLLLAPLAIACRSKDPLQAALAKVLSETSVDDSEKVYQAIRIAAPGGLGKTAEEDVSQRPTVPLQQAMRLAADRDLVARQYINGFAEVFSTAGVIQDVMTNGSSLHDAIVFAHVNLMSREPDSLIARKCGPAIAGESADRAAAVIDAGPVGGGAYQASLGDLDFWLRADGHRRNPGTTADHIAAALFVLLAEGRISWPVRFYAGQPPLAPSP